MLRKPSERVVVLREHEADAGLLYALRDLFGRQAEVGAHTLEHVGRAAGRRNGAASVFGYFRARRCGDKHGGGGDIEGFRAVAARADHVDQVFRIRYGHFGGKLAHHGSGGGDFRHGFHFDAQAGHDGGNLLGRDLPAHDLAHQVGHFVVEKLVVADQAFDGLLGGNHVFFLFEEAV